MLDTCRLASYEPKGKEKQAMKQQKAMLIALIVICLTVIVTALVCRAMSKLLPNSATANPRCVATA